MRMKKYNLTTALNIKIVSVVFLLMLTSTGYNHWFLLAEENAHNKQQLVALTEFLSAKLPPHILGTSVAASPDAKQANKEVRLWLHQELQSIVEAVGVPTPFIKFGFYSKACDTVVAAGPYFDRALLDDADTERFRVFQQTADIRYGEEKNSVLWHGATELIYIRPIKENGEIVGHAFASINQDMVLNALWKRTLNTFGVAFLMLLTCIVIFRELFVKLKKDLHSYAESILDGDVGSYRSEEPEFAPILSYISDQTKQMMRLDRLNITGEMAAGIAHEIRNPMTTVRGMLQFIGNKQEFSRHKENFTLMISELDEANHIITEFLSLAKNKSMKFESIDLNAIIKGVYPLLKADAMYHNCEVRLELQAIAEITADPSSMNQIILNTVKNSIDAMPNGGVITVRTAQTERAVFLSVQDEGIGIPDEIRERIGTPFFTTKDHGTGLGLAICYRIALRHRARLTIASTPGEGTTITIGFARQAPSEPGGETQ